MEISADGNPATGLNERDAAATAVRTCQWRPRSEWLENYRCSLPEDRDLSSFCILHEPSESKDAARFEQALWAKIEREEADPESDRIDLTGVVFATEADFRGRAFGKDVSFADAQFSGAASFWEAQFSGEASFGGAQFSGEAEFGEAQFSGAAYFWVAQFSGAADFEGAQFSGAADFWYAQFSGAAYFRESQFSEAAYFSGVVVQELLSFRGPTFPPDGIQKVIDFSDLTVESARRVRFEGVDLSRVSFLRTDVSQVRFVGCAWPKKNGRTVIYDEVALDEQSPEESSETTPLLVADLYRQLRLNYESNRQEVEAGHFYIGQMEMRRRDSNEPWLYRLMLGVYRALAMYGESYQRPVFWYLFFGAFFALAYLWGGFLTPGGGPVRYNPWSFDLGNAANFFKDGVRAYVQALTAGGLFGTNLGGLVGADWQSSSWWVPAVRYVNMVADTFLALFFGVALRRHFRR